MEPAQIEIVGFRKGYMHVVAVLEAARLQQTHLNPHVRHILNQAFEAVVRTLNEELDRTIRETYDHPRQTPILRIRQTPPHR